jgi:hypothetical protein
MRPLFSGRIPSSVVDPDPDHFGNLDPHPDPHPHQIKIRILIKIYKLDPELDPDPHQFADVKPKCMEYEPILHFFKGFSLFLASIWIRIRIRVISRIRAWIRIRIRIRIK